MPIFKLDKNPFMFENLVLSHLGERRRAILRVALPRRAILRVALPRRAILRVALPIG